MREELIILHRRQWNATLLTFSSPTSFRQNAVTEEFLHFGIDYWKNRKTIFLNFLKLTIEYSIVGWFVLQMERCFANAQHDVIFLEVILRSEATNGSVQNDISEMICRKNLSNLHKWSIDSILLVTDVSLTLNMT